MLVNSFLYSSIPSFLHCSEILPPSLLFLIAPFLHCFVVSIAWSSNHSSLHSFTAFLVPIFHLFFPSFNAWSSNHSSLHSFTASLLPSFILSLLSLIASFIHSFFQCLKQQSFIPSLFEKDSWKDSWLLLSFFQDKPIASEHGRHVVSRRTATQRW